MDSAIQQLAVGQLFAGDYRVIAPLADGGMGCVYVVEQVSTKRRRALKVMRADLVRDGRSRQRFLQEAQIGATIHSEHVVEVIAAGVDATTGTPWLAMELLSGHDLAAYVARHGPMPHAGALSVFRQLCHALDRAHAAGIIHRDLKPENIFIARSQRSDVQHTVKILDFGIAKWLSENPSTTTQPIGTPYWMAPEQSDPAAQVTPATDVWPLGLIAFFVLTGKPFWKTANTERPSIQHVLKEVLIAPIPPASTRSAELGAASLPAGFDDWFAACVAREPDARFATAAGALAALEPVLGHGGQLRLGVSVQPTAPMSGRELAHLVASSAPAMAPTQVMERPSSRGRAARRGASPVTIGCVLMSAAPLAALLCVCGITAFQPRQQPPNPATTEVRPPLRRGEPDDLRPEAPTASGGGAGSGSVAPRPSCEGLDWQPLRWQWTRLYHQGTHYPQFAADVAPHLRWQSGTGPVVRFYVRPEHQAALGIRTTLVVLYAEWPGLARPARVMRYEYAETTLPGDSQDLVVYVGERTDDRVLVSIEELPHPQRTQRDLFPGRSKRGIVEWDPDEQRLRSCGASWRGLTRDVPDVFRVVAPSGRRR